MTVSYSRIHVPDEGWLLILAVDPAHPNLDRFRVAKMGEPSRWITVDPTWTVENAVFLMRLINRAGEWQGQSSDFGKVWQIRGQWRGHTWGRRMHIGGLVTYDGVGTCVGPFDTMEEAQAAVDAVAVTDAG